MSCTNEVSFHVPAGYDYREVFVKCGNTTPRGGRAVCQECASSPREMLAIADHEENVAADNAWLRNAGWGEM
tara:strand:+ start:509 stop:724 length:216 start_codon:yes stop_codon:yes gene_type:complete